MRPGLPAPTTASPRYFTVVLSTLCLMGGVFLAERAFQAAMSLHRAGDRALILTDITIGPHAFQIPAGFIRSLRPSYDGLASTGAHRTASLLLTWPDLSMPGDPASSPRLGVPLPLIQIDLEYSPQRETLRAQLDPVYRRLAPGAQQRSPNGLNTLDLALEDTPEEDLIAYDPSAPTGFLTRCVRKRTADKSVCHRSVTPGKGLVIHYRFDQTLLPRWRALDQMIQDKVNSFRTN